MITVADLRTISSHIWLTSTDFDVLIAEQTITAETLRAFYMDVHQRQDIDERLSKVERRMMVSFHTLS